MLFNSIEFIVFFSLVVTGYFLLTPRLRWVLLLGASYWFYMAWEPLYALLILGSTVVDYVAGLQMGRQDARKKRRPWLLFSLCVNLGLLFTFKYFNFFSAALSGGLNVLGITVTGPVLTVLLPVGISFYTFQTLSYTIDVYRGNRSAEPHFGVFALYVAFFPQLVAGPIERSTSLLPQLRETHSFDRARVVLGLQMVLWGLFKKVVVADRLALYVNEVYGSPEVSNAPTLLLATYFFAFQIFCDFSAYSDIAIGIARILGIRLMENFRQPYLAQSMVDFWRRWHISLSTWFRDYVYIPLGGNRVTGGRLVINLLIVFVISGLWHGANWTFVVWGALHGLYLVAEVVLSKRRQKQSASLGRQVWRVVFTFHLVCLGWIFFRAESVQDAWLILGRMASSNWTGGLHMFPDVPGLQMWLAVGCMAVVVATDLLNERKGLYRWLAGLPGWGRWFLYTVVMLLIMNLGVVERTPFYYFQF